MTAFFSTRMPGYAPVALLAFAVCLGAFALLVPSGAHLLHFDAKAHMVVSRRVLDSITPGWAQLGVVWLPLPHILNALPAQNDFLYRTALFASLLGMAAFAAGVTALAGAAERVTADRRAGLVAACVPLANPGWLYLQGTPLTEPLFLGLVALQALFLVRWREKRSGPDLLRAGIFSALACLVRYEAWPIAAASVVVAFWPWPDEPAPARTRRRQLLRHAALAFFAPVIFYSLHSLYSVGRVLHAVDAHNLSEAGGDPWLSLGRLGQGLAAGFGWPLCVAGAASLGLLAWRRDPAVPLVVALLSPLVVTFTAYMAGHPVKARYALLLAPAIAMALANATRGSRPAQAVALGFALLQGPFLPEPLPVLVEATRDAGAVQARRPGLFALRAEYQGGRILAALGASAPLLFDLGIPIREIVHEGNEDLWAEAMERPASVAAWAIVYPWDPLGDRLRRKPDFLDGFRPVRRLGTATLYVRAPASPPP